MFKRIWNKYRQMPIQVKASIWFFICSFMQKGILTITTPIFTRLLTVSEYGQFNVFTSWLGILLIFVTLSLFQGTYLQGLVKFEENKEVFSSSLQGLSLALVLIWVCIYFLFSDFWNKLFGLNKMQMIALLTMCWTTAVYGFWATEQRVKYKYVHLVIVTIIASLVKPIVGIIMVSYAKDKVTARVMGLAAVEVLLYIWLFLAQMLRGRKFYSKKIWSYALLFAVPLIPHYLSATILGSADRIMIKSMVNEAAAGTYGLAYSISQSMTLFSSSLIQAINPWLYQRIKAGKIEEMGKIAYPALMVVAVVNILLILFAPEIMIIFAPSEYYDAIYVIPPVALSVFFTFSYDLFACFEFYYEKKKYIVVATTVAAITNIILNYIFVQIFGYYAAGYTTLLCYILQAFFHYFFMTKICRKYVEGKKAYNSNVLFRITFSFLLIGLLIPFTYNNRFIRYSSFLLFAVLILTYRKKIFLKISEIHILRKQIKE